MKTTPVVCISLTVMLLLAMTSAARDPAGALVETVRQATEQFQNVEEARRQATQTPSCASADPRRVPWASTSATPS